MHSAYELAYATACTFAATSGNSTKVCPQDPQGWRLGAPTVLALDDVSFARPVSIGDVVKFRADVVYTGSNESILMGNQHPGLSCIFQVRVETRIVDLKTGNDALSNEFHFTFLNRDPESSHVMQLKPIPVKPIEPLSYGEGMMWLDGRRRMLEALEVVRENKGFAYPVIQDLTTE
ncbi:hypothetical protein GUITHDRAFT_106611 [Guillardia theta CCMP2712]|uniref:HotDog ACOT-type domain-containing protein n=1 Tax=Guillardia theta (strain CCMP2712) TaxID=905079 RepID=L1JGH4_GUITC|nr:hypothetical protein GUITHDRAFT_106611 [Guillardia theta CCMP2712]EKX47623.1 hypothetical protein GUITHDRAFT_106611 [Guillardia theta CCMP2712]|eukprot:XP_005834603.1 hypothetical protein GUITHDRAFT_106611 [Guillardia theta CCMP2712]